MTPTKKAPRFFSQGKTTAEGEINFMYLQCILQVLLI